MFCMGKGGTPANPNQRATVAGQDLPNRNQTGRIGGGGQDVEKGEHIKREEENGVGGAVRSGQNIGNQEHGGQDGEHGQHNKREEEI